MRRHQNQKGGVSASDDEPYLEVLEYGADSRGSYEIDEDGDAKEGFYWRIRRSEGEVGTEIGPYSDREAAEKAGRSAYEDAAY